MATMQRMQVTGLELFYRRGYYSTSVDDILKELSLSKGAFYYHFESKEDFFKILQYEEFDQKHIAEKLQPHGMLAIK